MVGIFDPYLELWKSGQSVASKDPCEHHCCSASIYVYNCSGKWGITGGGHYSRSCILEEAIADTDKVLNM